MDRGSHGDTEGCLEQDCPTPGILLSRTDRENAPGGQPAWKSWNGRSCSQAKLGSSWHEKMERYRGAFRVPGGQDWTWTIRAKGLGAQGRSALAKSDLVSNVRGQRVSQAARCIMGKPLRRCSTGNPSEVCAGQSSRALPVRLQAGGAVARQTTGRRRGGHWRTRSTPSADASAWDCCPLARPTPTPLQAPGHRHDLNIILQSRGLTFSASSDLIAKSADLFGLTKWLTEYIVAEVRAEKVLQLHPEPAFPEPCSRRKGVSAEGDVVVLAIVDVSIDNWWAPMSGREPRP